MLTVFVALVAALAGFVLGCRVGVRVARRETAAGALPVGQPVPSRPAAIVPDPPNTRTVSAAAAAAAAAAPERRKRGGR